MALTREQLARRASQELQNGYYVNLGIGIPTMVADYIPSHLEVVLQSENGLLGIGPSPTLEEVDPDLINAGKQTITAIKGSSYFSSADSFAMIRGGHIDLSILGAMQVDKEGNLANWMIPGKMIKGMGGAMDLVAAAKRVVVVMEHASKFGEPKILDQCSLITDLCVIDVSREGYLELVELAPGVSREEVQSKTEPQLRFSSPKVMSDI